MADTDSTTEQMFSDFIRTLARGAFDEEVTAESRALAKELNRVGEISGGKPKGKIVVAVEFTWDRGMVDVNTKLNVTRPSPARAREVRYVTHDGRLTREDERQGRLFDAREIGTGDIKNVTT